MHDVLDEFPPEHINGGYLQWEDEDHNKSFRSIEKNEPQLQPAVDNYRGCLESGGVSLHTPENIEQACNTAGLGLINKSWYSTTMQPAGQVEETKS